MKLYSKEFAIAKEAIIKASAAVMDVYESSKSLDIEIKNDNSPVTRADYISNKIIVDQLKDAFPSYGILSEETNDDKSRLEKEYIWIIDPLDGTKDFIKHDDEFAINIALAKNGEIVLGLIMVPVINELYYAIKGKGSYILNNKGENLKIKVSNKKDNLILAISREHVSKKDLEFISQNKNLIKEVKKCGSSYKSCLLAKGEIDVQLKLAPGSKEWDIAPCDLLVSEAGGVFSKPNSEKYVYNKEDVNNYDGYIALNKSRKEFYER
ncbi:MAG: 3'(2'),5'-bisphosphate nucleotidase CysQ [Bacilli bacterium]|nr:3'(2'),5'-bisphosphate nucleotidase CysQ [Bacilli bacterium]